MTDPKPGAEPTAEERAHRLSPECKEADKCEECTKVVAEINAAVAAQKERAPTIAECRRCTLGQSITNAAVEAQKEKDAEIAESFRQHDRPRGFVIVPKIAAAIRAQEVK
jgi:hypothetical protein